MAPLSSWNWRTAGFLVSMPSPAGTSSGWPFTNTSRCECTWYSSTSAGSEARPAFAERAIGLLGAGHGAAWVAGVGTGFTAVELAGAAAVEPPAFDDEPPPLEPQPASTVT